jgi:hypothetical protein
MTDRYQIAADKSELLDVLLRYCRAIDRRDYDLLRTVYHPGAIDLHGGYFAGPAEEFFEEVPRQLAPFAATTHVITNAYFVVDGDRAEGESYLLANHVTLDSPPRNIMVSGRYLDRFERRNGEWRIAHRTCVVDWSNQDGDIDPAGIKGKPGREDESYIALPMLSGWRPAKRL